MVIVDEAAPADIVDRLLWQDAQQMLRRHAESGYDGLSTTLPSVTSEITRLALFLSSTAARHITGQTLHVSSGALAHFG